MKLKKKSAARPVTEAQKQAKPSESAPAKFVCNPSDQTHIYGPNCPQITLLIKDTVSNDRESIAELRLHTCTLTYTEVLPEELHLFSQPWLVRRMFESPVVSLEKATLCLPQLHTHTEENV